MNIMEIIFLIDFGSQFITSIPSSQKTDSVPIKSLSKIAQNYRNTYMIRDLIPLIPLQFLKVAPQSNIFWAIKIMRIFRGFEFINVQEIIKFFRDRYMKEVFTQNKELFEEWDINGNDEKIKLKDYTKIKEFLYAGYILKTFRLFIVIASVCFFFSMTFKILLEIQQDIVGHSSLTVCDDAGGYFYACYEFWQVK